MPEDVTSRIFYSDHSHTIMQIRLGQQRIRCVIVLHIGMSPSGKAREADTVYDFNNLFPNYTVTTSGKIFKDGVELKPFKSNKYLQVCLFDLNHETHVLGVHTVVAMRYIDEFYKGCIVHHIDGNTHNNCVDNLRVLSRSQHSSVHNKDNRTLAKHVEENGPHNKGKKMPESFRKQCSNSAKLRGFNGNQYIDKFGNRRK